MFRTGDLYILARKFQAFRGKFDIDSTTTQNGDVGVVTVTKSIKFGENRKVINPILLLQYCPISDAYFDVSFV